MNLYIFRLPYGEEYSLNLPSEPAIGSNQTYGVQMYSVVSIERLGLEVWRCLLEVTPEITTPSSDPKGANGAKKAPLHLLPPVAMEQTAWVHKLGQEKYGAFNWRSNNVCATTYVSAMRRHLGAWQDGEDLDPESTISHLAHIAASCNILMDAIKCGTLVDDRSKLPTP